MKLTNKVLAVLAASVVAAASFMGCDGFGKDDFYGTWTTEYTIPAASATDAQGGGYDKSYAEQKVELTMYFSGKTTSSAVSTVMFWQHKQRTDSENVVHHTFWVGTYNLSNNSELTSGDLELSYMYGYGWNGDFPSEGLAYSGKTEGTAKSVDDLVALAKAGDFAAFASISGIQKEVLTNNDKTYCTDIETFSFELGGASLFSGYTTMSATEKKWEKYQLKEGKVEKTVVDEDGCSWEVKSRSFTLAKDDGLDAESISDAIFSDDATATTSNNSVSFSRVLDDINIK